MLNDASQIMVLGSNQWLLLALYLRRLKFGGTHETPYHTRWSVLQDWLRIPGTTTSGYDGDSDTQPDELDTYFSANNISQYVRTARGQHGDLFALLLTPVRSPVATCVRSC
jgi:hypothetical protein